MIKSTRNRYCDHVQDIRNLSACVENSGELEWVVDFSLGGERWDGKEEEGETKEESVDRWGGYIMVFSDGITDGYIPSVIPSVVPSVTATSLYGYLSLNPSVIPSVKSSEKTPRHHAVASFQTNCILRRRNSRFIATEILCQYISTVSLTELGRWYIPTDFEMELLPMEFFRR